MISQMTPAGVEPGEAREVDGAFGLAGAHEHAAVARAQREDVAGRDEIVAAAVRRSIATRIVCARSAALMPVVTPWRASTVTVNAVPRRRRVPLRHHRQIEPLAALVGEAEADQAAAVRRHEVDGLRRHELGGHAEIALVLAVFVVDEDDHLAVPDVLDGLLDRRERCDRRAHDSLAGEALDDLAEDVDLEVDRVARLERARAS